MRWHTSAETENIHLVLMPRLLLCCVCIRVSVSHGTGEPILLHVHCLQNGTKCQTTQLCLSDCFNIASVVFYTWLRLRERSGKVSVLSNNMPTYKLHCCMKTEQLSDSVCLSVGGGECTGLPGLDLRLSPLRCHRGCWLRLLL